MRRELLGYALIFRLFKKGVPFIWSDKQQQAMDSLKQALTSAPAMVTSEGAGDIILSVDASLKGWGAVLQQLIDGKKSFARYEGGLWNEAESRYDAGKRECRGLLKALKKVRYWLYGVRFTIELDASTLVAQLNRSATDLPGALVTRWLAWIRLFDFDIRHVPGRQYGAPDGLSRRPRSPSDDYNKANDQDIDDARLHAVRVRPATIIPVEEDRVLDEAYNKESERIARYLTTLHRPIDITIKEFKDKALRFIV